MEIRNQVHASVKNANHANYASHAGITEKVTGGPGCLSGPNEPKWVKMCLNEPK